MMRRFIVIAFLFATSQAWAAFGYYSPISVNSSQVPSTQTDFPVLVSVTDTRFKTVGNGGHVQNSSGFDIRPYTDSTLATAITGYGLERYNASTGEVIMWVKVSSLSSSTTPFVLAYGDATISTDGTSTTAWSNNFIKVFHAANGATLNLTDATGGTNWGGSPLGTASTGQIDGGVNFVAASQQVLTQGLSSTPTSFTFSAWVNATTLPNAYNAVISCGPTTTMALFVKSTGKLACYLQGTGQIDYDGTGSHTLSTSTWTYLVMTYDPTAGLVGYFNGASDGTAAANGNTTSHSSLGLATDLVTSSRNWNGNLDEARLATGARSANWITTEYNNQSAPGTFETLGTEVALGVTNKGFFYLFP